MCLLQLHYSIYLLSNLFYAMRPEICNLGRGVCKTSTAEGVLDVVGTYVGDNTAFADVLNLKLVCFWLIVRIKGRLMEFCHGTGMILLEDETCSET